MKKNRMILLLLIFLTGCNNNVDYDDDQLIDDLLDTNTAEIIFLAEDSISSNSSSTSGLLYSYKMSSTLSKLVTDKIISNLDILQADLIELNNFMILDMKRILLDKNNVVLDSLTSMYPYTFPSGDLSDNYFDELKIEVTSNLSVSFKYKGELIGMDRYYKEDDKPTLSRVTKEKYTQFRVELKDKLVFAVEYGYIEKTVVLITPFDLSSILEEY